VLSASSRPLILHGNNIDGNRGCQALKWCSQQILGRHLPDYQYQYANLFRSPQPERPLPEMSEPMAAPLWEVRRRGVPSFYIWGAGVLASRLTGRFPVMHVHRELPASAGLILLGGDNLSYDYGLLAALLFFSPLETAIRLRVPTIVWAGSVGPFHRYPQWERRFVEVLRKTDLIIARESLTEKYLGKLGIHENVRRATDSAFLLPAVESTLPDEIENVLQQGAIGINLGPWMMRHRRSLARQGWSGFVKWVVTLQGRVGAPVILVPHVMMHESISPNNDDYLFMKRIYDRLPAELKRSVHLYDAREADCRQIKWVISRLRGLVSSRFHATIAGLSTGVPTVTIGYGIKARGLHLDMFGHDQWCVDISEAGIQSLAERLDALLSREQEVRAHLKAVVPRFVEDAWKSGRYSAELLKPAEAERE
jgi:colanic acid/amylovoran biosynthesis protein